jgi:hypothetical protein
MLITGSKKQIDEEAALFDVQVHAIVSVIIDIG